MRMTIQELFDTQARIQKIACGVTLPAHNEDLAMYYGFGLFTELGEVFQADKSWKMFNKGPRNAEEVLEELVDCQLFLTNLMLAQRISAEDFEAAYRKKAAKVIERAQACKTIREEQE